LIDWFALRIFARRHRDQILRERIELLRPDKRPRKTENGNGNGKGHGNGPLGDLFP
jgi:hypothetical protein